jgi:hypothetical protein
MARARPRRGKKLGASIAPGPYITEQRVATRYTERWHHVRTWALRVCNHTRTVTEPVARSPRIYIVDGRAVDNLYDDDEAESVATDLAALTIEVGPDAKYGGRRRCIVRVFTWLVDENAGGLLYQGQWITTGEGHSARSASGAHNRYVRAYADAVAHGVESRLLSATAIQVLWWTMAKGARYV